MAYQLTSVRTQTPALLAANSPEQPSGEIAELYSPGGTAFRPLNGAVPVSVVEITEEIKHEGFAIVGAREFQRMLLEKRPLMDGASYMDSWNTLTPCSDPYYLFDGEMYHSRHYTLGVMDLDANEFVIQSRRSPSYGHGQLSPLTPANMSDLLPRISNEVFESDAHQAYLSVICDFLQSLRPDVKRWEIEDYQIRVRAAARGGKGVEPAPEGIHQDEVQHVFITMIRRQNIEGGITYVRSSGEDKPSNVLGLPRPLAETWETLILDDEKVWHQISAILPSDEQVLAFRDIIVVKCKLADSKAADRKASDQ